MKKIYGTVLLALVFCMLFSSLSLALNTDTHESINELIVTNSMDGFSLDVYLKDQLGLTNGIKEEFKADKTKNVFEWIKVGGLYEDIPVWYLPYLRSVNHFYNPINKGGFTGIWDTGFLSGMPAYDPTAEYAEPRRLLFMGGCERILFKCVDSNHCG